MVPARASRHGFICVPLKANQVPDAVSVRVAVAFAQAQHESWVRVEELDRQLWRVDAIVGLSIVVLAARATRDRLVGSALEADEISSAVFVLVAVALAQPKQEGRV